MVRDKVEDLAHRMRMERPDPRLIILPRPDRSVELVVVGDVVAVQTVWARLEIRRCVHVTDSQCVEIGDDLACLRKSEPTIELQSVGATGNARVLLLCHAVRSHDTLSNDEIRMTNDEIRNL